MNVILSNEQISLSIFVSYGRKVKMESESAILH